MSNTHAAVVLGASGSVGIALIKELLRDRSFKTIVSLVRRSQPDQVALAREAGIELREKQIARAMIATALNPPAKTAVFHYPEMMALNG